jgi:hypothetical protein
MRPRPCNRTEINLWAELNGVRLGRRIGSEIDSGLDARLHLLAVGKLDRKSRDQLFIELAKNPALVGRLAEHLHALSPL